MNQGGGGRDESRAILHMDMDAFYASVEQLDEPRLRGKAVLVGGLSRRSVVAAASYEARPFGVRSAMSMVEALRLCPSAIVKVPRFGRYREVSEAVFAIFRRYTPLVEGLSVGAAVRQSLLAVSRNLLRNHLTHCAAGPLAAGGDPAAAMIDELAEMVAKVAR